MKKYKQKFQKLFVGFYFTLYSILKWVREKVQISEIRIKAKYEARKNNESDDQIFNRGTRKDVKSKYSCRDLSVEEGSGTQSSYVNKGPIPLQITNRNNSRKQPKPFLTLNNEKNCIQRKSINTQRIGVHDRNRGVSRNKTSENSYFSDSSTDKNEIFSRGNGRFRELLEHGSINSSKGDLPYNKNTKWWIFGFIIEKCAIVIEQIKHEGATNTTNKVYLSVVTSEMFEEAMRASQMSLIELTYTNLFPSDCRMFICVPIYKDGYIHKKDQLLN